MFNVFKVQGFNATIIQKKVLFVVLVVFEIKADKLIPPSFRICKPYGNPRILKFSNPQISPSLAESPTIITGLGNASIQHASVIPRPERAKAKEIMSLKKKKTTLTILDNIPIQTKKLSLLFLLSLKKRRIINPYIRVV